MHVRFVASIVFVFIFSSVQICSSADISPDLIKKVEQLEKELLELKREHQDRVRAKALDEDVKPILAQAPTSEKIENKKKLIKSEVAEKEPQESPDYGQAAELYAQAQILLNQKHPEQAKTILVNLCEAYPESPHFIMAKYWLGEIGLAVRDHTNASIAYGEAYSSYKERLSNKEPISDEVRNRAIESLAKLASCLKVLNKKQDACVTLEQFNKEASNIPYNIQRFALQVSDQLKCQKKPQL